MSMVTSCPGCATTFRVTPQQLQTRHGKVRCGRCATVFDAFKSLATLPDQTPLEPVAGKPAESAEAPLPDLNFATADPPPPEAPVAAPAEAVPAELVLAPAPGPAVEREPASVIDTPLTPLPRRPRRGIWATASAVLALLLLLQGAYLFRIDLATQLPALRPALEKACDALGCAVGFPQRSDMLSIEASDLQVADPVRPNLIVLSATLRNRAPNTLAYPALELTLTNPQDQTVARRVFLPAEYLGSGARARTGMASNAEVNLKLDLDTADLKAAGYRLYLFYP